MPAQASLTAKSVHQITVDIGSIDDGNVEEVAATVPGAALGDFPYVVKPTDDNVYPISAWVSAANTVKIVFFNPSGGTVNPASQTVNVILF